jgi:hypothetical protein
MTEDSPTVDFEIPDDDERQGYISGKLYDFAASISVSIGAASVHRTTN